MKYDAFISYSRRDFDEVNAFLQIIRREVPDFKYWFDLEGIESGEEFVRKIVSAIDDSERILFMLSDNSINSGWAEQEVMYARNSGKRVIPILLKGAKLKGWFLFTFGNIDSIDTQDSRQISKLIANLRQWCGSKTISPEISTKSKKKIPASKPINNPTEVNVTEVNTEIPKRTKRAGKWGYKNKNGDIVIACIYDNAYSFYNGYFAVVKKNNKYGFIDVKGNVLVPCIFDQADKFSNDRALVKKDDKYGFINTQGSITIPCIYEYAYTFGKFLACVKKDGKYGYIDKVGNIVVPLIYDYAQPFLCGRACVTMNGKSGYIDEKGNIVIPLIYDSAGNFDSMGSSLVNKDGKYFYIDKNGN